MLFLEKKKKIAKSTKSQSYLQTFPGMYVWHEKIIPDLMVLRIARRNNDSGLRPGSPHLKFGHRPH
jgi:hypothetical protein